MRFFRSSASVVLTLAALLVVAGGCVRSMVLVFEAVEQEARPNGALIVFFLTIIVGALLAAGARALSPRYGPETRVKAKGAKTAAVRQARRKESTE